MPGSARGAAITALAAALLLLSHAALLTLPFYWDEVGQFVPASLDLFHSGALVPYSTVPNVHPPGLMAYLAGVWRVFGYSVAATRVAMLCLGSAGLALTYLITRKLAPEGSGEEPAWAAAGLLALSPLFFSQAMMAQLDMPAMVCFALAFWLFLEDRIAACAAACAVLVLVKETGIAAPMLFGAWLLRERRWRESLWLFLPLPGLIAWLLLLRHATGHLFGNAEFTDYNLFYPLHPVRLVLALVRRCYYAFVANGHVIGLLALTLTRRLPLWQARQWRAAWVFVGLHLVLISALGGAVLERYLLPVFPILFAAFALAIWELGRRLRPVALTIFAGLLLAGIFVNPPFPFPLENNLAWTSFVRLEQQAAAFVEQRYPTGTIATSFPLASALRRPEYGFVRHAMRLEEISDFQPDKVAGLRGRAGVLVLYRAMWDPLGLMSNPQWTGFLSRYYGYAPQVTPADVKRLLGARLVAQWAEDGQEMWCFELPK